MPAQNDMPSFRSDKNPEMREEMQAGFAILKQGDTEGARQYFSALLEKTPDLAPAHLGLGRVFMAEGNHRKALEHFQEAVALQPNLAHAQLSSAEAREQLGEIDAALADYDAAIVLDPSLGASYLRKAQLLERGNRHAEAQETLSEAIRRSPQDAGLRMALASAMARNGTVAQSEAEFRRAIDLQPDMWYAHFGLGTSLLSSKQYGPARDALTLAAKLAPERPAVFQALGAAHTGLGDHIRAAKAYDDAMRLDPSNMRATVGAAMARSAAGQHREALEVLRNVGRMGNRIPAMQKALGDIYLAMDRPADAVDAYRAMILNSTRIAGDSDLVTLANSGGDADPAVFARQLQEAISTQRDIVTAQMRANPQMRRDRMMSRRQQGQGRGN